MILRNHNEMEGIQFLLTYFLWNEVHKLIEKQHDRQFSSEIESK